MAGGKGGRREARAARDVKDLRRELRRVEDDLETARRKRDRAQARVEALEALAAQVTAALEAAKAAANGSAASDATPVASPAADRTAAESRPASRRIRRDRRPPPDAVTGRPGSRVGRRSRQAGRVVQAPRERTRDRQDGAHRSHGQTRPCRRAAAPPTPGAPPGRRCPSLSHGSPVGHEQQLRIRLGVGPASSDPRRPPGAARWRSSGRTGTARATTSPRCAGCARARSAGARPASPGGSTPRPR